MSAFSNFDDLQFSGLGTESTALCEICRESVYIDSEKKCKVCGHDTSSAGSAAPVSTSTPASMQSLLQGDNRESVGSGADGWTEYTGSLLGLTAQGQRGISPDRLRAMLADIGFLDMEGSLSAKPPPASKKIISNLVRVKVTEDDINQIEALQKNFVTFTSTGQSAVVIPGMFGRKIVEEETYECVLANPIHAHPMLANEKEEQTEEDKMRRLRDHVAAGVKTFLEGFSICSSCLAENVPDYQELSTKRSNSFFSDILIKTQS